MLTNLQQWKSNQNCDSLSLFLSQVMMSLSQQFGGLKCLPLSTSTLSRKFISRSFAKQKQLNGCHAARRIVAKAVAIRNAETKERLKLKEMFAKAYERCRTAPMEGVCFTLEDFHSALDKFNFNSEIGAKVKGIVFSTDASGAVVDITAKSSAHLPLCETSILDIKHVEEAGILPGLREVFVVVGKNEEGDSLILSLQAIQNELAWERCRQLHAEDVIVKGKIVGANKGGVVAVVEGLRGFVPFSHISAKSAAEELFDKELPLKFVEVDEDQVRLVLSNRKAMSDNQSQLGVGSVVSGTVQSIKPYGAFIDIGGINGLLHVSQISHDRVQDIAIVLQPGNILKVMILSHDHERGRVSLSTKKLEPTPGDMIRNPGLVFEKAEAMAETFRQRIAQAEAMARVDILSFQAESGLTLNSEGIFGPPSSELPAQGLDMNDILSAEDPTNS